MENTGLAIGGDCLCGFGRTGTLAGSRLTDMEGTVMTDAAAEATLREITLKRDTRYWKVPDRTRPLRLETRGGWMRAGEAFSVGPARNMYTDGSVQAVPFIHQGEDCFFLVQDLDMPELYTK